MPTIDFPDLPWQPCHLEHKEVPDQLQEWLQDRGSLTARLKQTYSDEFRVKVLRHDWAEPTDSERKFLGCCKADASIREVLLICGNTPKVFARSILPRESLTGSNQQLLALGNKPLGEFLFADKNLRRGHIEQAALSANHFNPYLSYSYTKERAWGRRSLFYLNEKPISVCEVFLPEIGGRLAFP